MGILESILGPNIAELEARHDIEGLSKALHHKKNQVRLRVVEAFGRLCDTRSVEALIVALKDENWEVRKTVAEALGEIGDKSAVIPLIALLNSTTDVAYKMEILKNYQEQGMNGLDFGQIKAHKSQIKMAQEAAARALGKIGDQGIVGSLIQTLQRWLWLWRHSSFSIRMKPEEVIQALEDEEEVIRAAIHLAVTRRHLSGGSLANTLKYLCTDLTGFSKLQPEAVATLIDTMKTLDLHSDALDWVIRLIKIMPDEEHLVEKAILQALGRLGGGQARKVLTEISEKTASPLREIAITALEQMVKPDAKPEVQIGQPLFCCACGKDLTGMAAMVDHNTDAVYCDNHASSYHSSFRGIFRSCRGCGYRYHLEAGSQIRICPHCGIALSPGTDPE